MIWVVEGSETRNIRKIKEDLSLYQYSYPQYLFWWTENMDHELPLFGGKDGQEP
jgi:hypothetical protein